MSNVLAGIRVVDFGRYVAAPYCATLLGYLGADVIRVERPGGGEDRAIAPLRDDGRPGDGAVFMQTGCNKRSLCLRLTDPAGRDVRDKLIASADVVVSNFPVAFQRRAEMDIDSLRALRPDIILANVSSFGADGPYAKRGGFDGIGQAMSGAAWMTGTPGAPVKAAAPYVDYSTAVLTAFAVMAALRERDLTGQGQEIASTLLGTALAVFNSHLIEQGVLGLDRVGTGNRVQTSAPSDVFATQDGHVLVHCPGDAIFRRWAQLVGKDDWCDDPRFANDQLRGDQRDTICAPMATWCASRTTEDVLETLAQQGIPAGPILSPREALAHPQTAALGVLGAVEYPGLAAPVPVAGLPFTLSGSGSEPARERQDIRTPPPAAGEHTDAILAELGFDDAQVAALREQGTVA